jgi:hypothetical protein
MIGDAVVAQYRTEGDEESMQAIYAPGKVAKFTHRESRFSN